MMFAVRGRGVAQQGLTLRLSLIMTGVAPSPDPTVVVCLYCVCSDDLCFMFGVTLLLYVGDAVFAQCQQCAEWPAVPVGRWRSVRGVKLKVLCSADRCAEFGLVRCS